MGRDKKNEQRGEHFTKTFRSTMETSAWLALSPKARLLYPWLKLEWHGPKANNNGRLRLSVAQAAKRIGFGVNATGRGFHELQAKGFIVQTEGPVLGTGDNGKSAAYEVTEIALPTALEGRHLYRNWREGQDFPVKRARSNNPTGRNGKRLSDGVVVPLSGGQK